MEGSAGTPQRVCPKCARISWATGPQCPYCRARFTRAPGVRPWMLAATAFAVLLGVLAMFLIAGQRFEDRVDDVDQRVDRTLNQIRTDVRRELDARLPPGGAVAPTPTPFATPAPTPTPTVEGEATETPAAEPTGEPDDGTGVTPTPTAPIQP